MIFEPITRISKSLIFLVQSIRFLFSFSKWLDNFLIFVANVGEVVLYSDTYSI